VDENENENNELTTIHEHEELEDSPTKKVKVVEFEFENPQKLEPDQNYSNYLSDQRPFEQNSEALKEEWIQEEFIDLVNDAKMIGFYFLSTRMMVIYEDF
jgi:hypothetical protein